MHRNPPPIQRRYRQLKQDCDPCGTAYSSSSLSGRKLSQTFNEQFFAQLAPMLGDISDEDAACTIRTIQALYDVMAERRVTLVY